ncbi:MAG: fibronectin type III domain-containing protein, partial [Bacteroidetes bacterium]|nr:fibronectin type III domain-containing protein [Bacteroidota bacterium]
MDASIPSRSPTASIEDIPFFNYSFIRPSGVPTESVMEASTAPGSNVPHRITNPMKHNAVSAESHAGLLRQPPLRANNSVRTLDNSRFDDEAAPGAPTNLTATAIGTSLIKLSWDAPTNTGAGLTVYFLEQSTDGDAESPTWRLITNPLYPQTTRLVLSHTAATTYWYRIRVTDNASELSPYSNIANATTGDAAAAPGTPTSLTATADGPTTINLSWTAPTSTGGTAITGYRILVSPNLSFNYTTVVANTGNTNTSYSHTGLRAGTRYDYHVLAINAATNIGPNSSSATHATTAAATAPGAPTSLTTAADGQTTIDLSWTAPTSDGGAAISGYRIEVSTDGGTNFSQLVASQSGTSYSHTGLTAGTARHYRVRAINSVGSSGWSNTANATTAAATAPGAPTSAATAPGAPTSLTATADG